MRDTNWEISKGAATYKLINGSGESRDCDIRYVGEGEREREGDGDGGILGGDLESKGEMMYKDDNNGYNNSRSSGQNNSNNNSNEYDYNSSNNYSNDGYNNSQNSFNNSHKSGVSSSPTRYATAPANLLQSQSYPLSRSSSLSPTNRSKSSQSYPHPLSTTIPSTAPSHMTSLSSTQYPRSKSPNSTYGLCNSGTYGLCGVTSCGSLRCVSVHDENGVHRHGKFIHFSDSERANNLLNLPLLSQNMGNDGTVNLAPVSKIPMGEIGLVAKLRRAKVANGYINRNVLDSISISHISQSDQYGTEFDSNSNKNNGKNNDNFDKSNDYENYNINKNDYNEKYNFVKPNDKEKVSNKNNYNEKDKEINFSKSLNWDSNLNLNKNSNNNKNNGEDYGSGKGNEVECSGTKSNSNSNSNSGKYFISIPATKNSNNSNLNKKPRSTFGDFGFFQEDLEKEKERPKPLLSVSTVSSRYVESVYDPYATDIVSVLVPNKGKGKGKGRGNGNGSNRGGSSGSGNYNRSSNKMPGRLIDTRSDGQNIKQDISIKSIDVDEFPELIMTRPPPPVMRGH